MCVVVDELDYMQCEYNSEGIYMPNKCKKRNHFVDSGLEVRVRCGKRKDNLCVKNKIKAKITVLDGWWPEDASMPNTWKKNKGVCG